ncbi:MAG TPA: hypothetical protein VE642_09715 [Pyrinomonadaceae bacterium]|jgi:hypothetical protein|nr:hypothetical protein [Pyrinomonadaceae bacterium]
MRAVPSAVWAVKVTARSMRPVRVMVNTACLVSESPSVTVTSSMEMVGSGSSFVMVRVAVLGEPSCPEPAAS